ncbi:MAG: Single-stranded DNA-binding replication protein A (RPA), large subunit [Candidatus Methanohalarchaeum thermophilum]|uniref:Single-stranded DNA-binding replication protein A (RPA), large subunit n=1 Tax=Methanohalarchaeum thermophilum TaxID=1903181 RepID=A0A1Q6DT93_METT1|nr:MAG: Single-stranded DNA-binding replication protein A (RPA), large subunit [Candidatus Methanohalarchaeum thermophilum]
MEPRKVFEKIRDEGENITKEEFKELVEDKVDELGGLCDHETASKLVAHDLGVNPEEELVEIGDISEDMERVSFIGKVVETGDVNSFERDDGSVGRVGDITLGDESGEIRVVFWDDNADLIKVGEIVEGDVLKVKNGNVQEGYSGLEVNVTGVTDIDFKEDEEIDFERETIDVGDLEEEMGSVHVRGEVLDVGEKKEFERDDGSMGAVRSLTIGDGSGRIDVSLWDDHAEMGLEVGDQIKIEHGYTRERYGNVELNVGYRGKVKESDRDVVYRENFADLGDLSVGDQVDVRVLVTGCEDIYVFERDDGSEGKVANLHLRDETGECKAALWGEKAGLVEDVEVGDRLKITDAEVRSGRSDEPELSLGWKSGVKKINSGRELVKEDLCNIEPGLEVEVVGTIVDDGILDDGTGCVKIDYGDVPGVGVRIRVSGVVQKKNGRSVLVADEVSEVDVDEGLADEVLEEL